MENYLKIEELDMAIKNMAKGKSPGVDGLTVEFYLFFWSEIRIPYKAFKECISNRNVNETWSYDANSKT